MRCSWDDILRVTAIEFLNIICYSKDKAAWQQDEIKKWQKKN